jgi:phosphoglycolate phosphatase-like HAD superfamily hydrolase
VTKDPDAEIGIKLGEEFDRLYVALVSPTSVPLFDGIPSLLRGLKQSNPGLRIGALTNACSDYARAIYSCNEVISSTFDICYGVDDVPNAKPR